MGRFLLMLSSILCLALMSLAGYGETIGQAKVKPDGSSVSVVGTVISSNPQEFYIESTDGCSGIWVLASSEYAATNNIVEITGTLNSMFGEHVITDAQVSQPKGQFQIKPMGMSNRAVGGASYSQLSSIYDYLPHHIPGDGIEYKWTPAGGANNTGLLVTTWGTVNAVYYSPITSAKWFYIDDGYGAVSDYGDQGVLVYSDVDVKEYNYIKVTGLSSVEPSFEDPTKLIRVIRPRNASDISTVKEDVRPDPYPISDEFNDSTLGKLWCGYASLRANPGYATIRESKLSYGTGISQRVPGNWEADIKIKIQMDSSTGLGQIYINVYGELIRIVSGSGNLQFEKKVYFQHAVDPQLELISNYTGDICYLHLKHVDNLIYCSVSSDGINYSTPLSITTPSHNDLLTISTRNDKATIISALVDYIRFTNVVK